MRPAVPAKAGSQSTQLLVIQHLEREGPGLLGEIARERNLDVRILHPYAGDPLPEELEPGQVLAVMGGPMGVADLGNPAFPWLEPLASLLRSALAAEQPVLGFCLGAQLLAWAAGGEVRPMLAPRTAAAQPELGFGSIRVQSLARREPVLRGLPDAFTVLHWHGDRILLPPSATLLASSGLCAEQLFRIGARAYGLQCHVEVSGEALERWISEDRAFVVSALGASGPGRVRADGERLLPALLPLWRRLLGQLLDQLTDPCRDPDPLAE